MAIKRIYLIRHGQVAGAGGERRYLGQSDVKLDDQGYRQANAVGRWLRFQNISRLFCSDLSRTVATAAAIGRVLDLPPEPRDDLREINMGVWDGLARREVAARYPEEVSRRNEDLMAHRPPGGESFNDCGERVWRVLNEILAEPEAEMAIVAHAGVNRLLLSRLLGMPRENMFRLLQQYGCINILSFGEWGGRMELLNYCPGQEEKE